MDRIPKPYLVAGFLILCAVALGWSATLDNLNFMDRLIPAGGGFIALMLALAIIIPWGKPYTTRIMMGLMSVGLIIMAIWVLATTPLKFDDIKWLVIAGIMSIFPAIYAITGRYPRHWPFAEVFAYVPPSEQMTVIEDQQHQNIIQ
jgi:hypothetical protein